MLIAVVQGVELRGNTDLLSPELKTTLAEVRAHILFLETDRALDKELRHCIDLIRQRHWSLYE